MIGGLQNSEVEKDDELIKCNEGNPVIDTASAFYLSRTELDYVEEALSA